MKLELSEDAYSNKFISGVFSKKKTAHRVIINNQNLLKKSETEFQLRRAPSTATIQVNLLKRASVGTSTPIYLKTNYV